MADRTKIEWASATVNAINGCTLVDEGGRHCYAARLAATRMKSHPTRAGLARLNAAGEAKFTGEVRLHEPALLQPLQWRKPREISWNAHGDTFHENVPDEWIDRMMAVIALTPQHRHMVLTKRPDRARAYLTALYGDEDRGRAILDASRRTGGLIGDMPIVRDSLVRWPFQNLWLGTSASDQASADARIPDLLATPAAVRFLSAEPLLGPLDLTLDSLVCRPCPYCLDASPDWETGMVECRRCDSTGKGDEWGLDWVIVGGESGPKARPMHPDWARGIRDQCQAAGVAFFFKQWGEWKPSLDRDRDDPDWRADYTNNYVDRGKSRWLNLEGGRGFHGDRFHVMARVGKASAGRLLDGREWSEVAA